MRTVLLAFTLVLTAFAEDENVEPSWGVTPEKLERARQELATKWMIGFEKEYAHEVIELVTELGGTFNRQFRLVSVMSVDLPTTVDDDERHPLIQRIQRHKRVNYIEKDLPRFPLAETIPYGVTNVQSQQVWNSSDTPTQGAGIIVCVIDSGLDRTHEDFVDANITNTNSYADWRYDGCNHGNHVSGTVGAVTFNDIGVASVAPQVAQYIVRVFSGSDCAWSATSGLIGAVDECVIDGNADIISMSLGGSGGSSSASNAFAAAYDNNVFSIAAAGNSGDSSFSYPASYSSVFSVAAVNSNNVRASFSQYNSAVDIAAPGVGVLSTVTGSDGGSSYASYQGTSMACPHVSAVAALTWATRPDLSAASVRYCLEKTALDLGEDGRDDEYGYGLAQAYDAHQCALKIFRSSLDCNFVTIGETIFGLNKCHKSADETSESRYSKMLINGQDGCTGSSTTVTRQYFATESDCIESNNLVVSSEVSYKDIICNGDSGDSCQVMVTGYVVADGVDCVNDIDDILFFENQSPLFKTAIVMDVCVNIGSNTSPESYKWSFDEDSQEFVYEFYSHADCSADDLVLRWDPPESCQTRDDSQANSANMLQFIDEDIPEGTEMWLNFDLSNFLPTTQNPTRLIQTQSPTSSPVVATEPAVTSTFSPGLTVLSQCSDAKETSLERNVNGTYLMTNVTFKFGEGVSVSKDVHSLFVSVHFNTTMIDEMSIYLSHQSEQGLLMRSICERKHVSLNVVFSDDATNDISAFCDRFSGTGVTAEVLTREEIDEIFFAQEIDGEWVVSFVDGNTDDPLGSIGTVCMGWRETSNESTQSGSVGLYHFNRLVFYFAMALVMSVVSLV